MSRPKDPAKCREQDRRHKATAKAKKRHLREMVASFNRFVMAPK